MDSIRVELAGLDSLFPFLVGSTAGEFTGRAQSDEANDLAQQMLLHAKAGYESALALQAHWLVPQQFIVIWSKRLMAAEERLNGPSVAAASRHVERMERQATPIREKFAAGTESQMSVADAQYAVAEAKLMLSQRK